MLVTLTNENNFNFTDSPIQLKKRIREEVFYVCIKNSRCKSTEVDELKDLFKNSSIYCYYYYCVKIIMFIVINK